MPDSHNGIRHVRKRQQILLQAQLKVPATSCPGENDPVKVNHIQLPYRISFVSRMLALRSQYARVRGGWRCVVHCVRGMIQYVM